MGCKLHLGQGDHATEQLPSRRPAARGGLVRLGIRQQLTNGAAPLRGESEAGSRLMERREELGKALVGGGADVAGPHVSLVPCASAS